MTRLAFAVFAALGFFAVIAAAQTPHYSFAEITPQPLRLWTANGLGSQGQVVGRTWDLNVTPPLCRGFVWQNGVMTLLDGPAGETLTEARCVDNQGVIYGGYADRRFDLQFLKMNPARWFNGVPTPYPNNMSINSSTIFACSPTTGAAVGWSKPFVPLAPGWQGQYGYFGEPPFDVNDPVRAFIWTAEGGSVLTKTVGNHDDRASDINDAGQAAVTLGSYELGGAAIYDPRFGTGRLPGLGGGEPGTDCFAINSAGKIAGYATTAGGLQHPVVWDHGALTDLGLLAGLVKGWAFDINDAGVTVGGLSDHNFIYGLQPTAGFVVINGTMLDLNTLIPPGTGFVIHQAQAINNAGQILVAMNPMPSLSATRYAVLTPVP